MTTFFHRVRLRGRAWRSIPLVAALLVALFIASPAAYALNTGQAADLVLGQGNFDGADGANPPNAASLNQPSGIAIHVATGKLFVADSANNRVLRYASVAALANNAPAEFVFGQTTPSGNGPNTAKNRLRRPVSVFVDTAARLWVADTDNHRVLWFDNAVAVTPQNAPSTPLEANGVLGRGGFTTTTAPASPPTASSMKTPTGVYGDAAGTIWVADMGNNRVLRFDNAAAKTPAANAANGVLGQNVFTTNASTPLAANSMSEPHNVMVDTAGRLWVADKLNNRVLRFDNAATKADGANADAVLGQGSFATNAAGQGPNGMSQPHGVYVSQDGRLFVADTGRNRVTWFDNAATKANGADANGVVGQPTIAGTGASLSATSLSSPTGVVYIEAVKALWVADRNNNRVVRYTEPQAPVVTSAAPANGTYRTAYTHTFTADGFPKTFTFTVSAGALPPGLTLNQTTGVLSGVPTQADTYSFTVTVSNGVNPAATQDVTLVIAKVGLTATAQNASRMYGAAAPAFALSYTGFVGGDNDSVVTGAASFDTGTMATSPVGTYTITPTLGTLAAQNYTITTFVNGTLTVTKAPLTVVADNQTRTYGASNPTLTVSYTGFTNGENPSVLTGVAGVSTSATATSPVGGYDITPTLGTLAATNYDITNFTNGTLAVTKATLTVTADAQSRTYGAMEPVLTAQISGYVNGEDASAVSGEATLTTTASNTSAVGTYTITPELGTLAATNYGFAFVSGDLTITKATLTVNADNQSRMYGTDNPNFTAEITGFVNGEDASVVSGEPMLSTLATSTSTVGSYAITSELGTLTADNYDFAFTGGTLEVTKAPLTITVQDKVRKIGTLNPTFTFLYQGFVNGEDEGVLLTGATATTTATTESVAGDYAIVASGATATNYEITFVNGTLRVSLKDVPQLAWADPQAITYGTPLTAAQLNATVSLNNSEVAGTFTYNPSLDMVLHAGTDQVLQVTFTPADQAAFETVTDSVQITVGKAALTITADNKTRKADQDNPVLTVNYSGFVGGDTASVLDTPVAVTTAATKESTAGSYDIVASGAADADYAIMFVKGTLTVEAVEQPEPEPEPTQPKVFLPLTMR